MKSLKLFLFSALYFAAATIASAGIVDGAIGYKVQTVHDQTVYFNANEACAAAASYSPNYIGAHYHWHPEYCGGCMYDTVITPWYTMNNWFAQNWVVPVTVCPAGASLVDSNLNVEHPWAKCMAPD